ncbi:MAG: DUF6442 family protein [Bacillota bacterium]
MKNKEIKFYILLIISIAVLSFGFISLNIKLFTKQWIAISYILVGIGFGGFGHSLGTIIKKNLLKKNSEVAKKITIEKNDERNISLMNSAKSKAFNAMIYIYGVVIFVLVLLNVELYIILFLISAYILVCGIYIYNFYKIRKFN